MQHFLSFSADFMVADLCLLAGVLFKLLLVQVHPNILDVS